MNPIVSIIVPVYNTESYLDKCISSISTQTYQQLEIIIVNDGSTDLSGQICKYWCDQDDRIILINSENQGLSSARNKGIEKAKGEYLAFVDSDDFLDSRYVELLLLNIEKNRTKICMCNFYAFFEDHITFDGQTRIYDENLSTVEFLKKVYTFSGFYVPVWNKLYHKSVFENIRFTSGVANEDSYIIKDIVLASGDIACISTPLYNYRQRSGSLMDKSSTTLLKGELNWILKDIDFWENTDSVLFGYSSKLFCNKIIHFYMDLNKETKKIVKNEFKDKCKNIFKCSDFNIQIKMKYFFYSINLDLMCKKLRKSK